MKCAFKLPNWPIYPITGYYHYPELTIEVNDSFNKVHISTHKPLLAWVMASLVS